MDGLNFIGNVGFMLIIISVLSILYINWRVGKENPLMVLGLRNSAASAGMTYPKWDEYFQRTDRIADGVYGSRYQQAMRSMLWWDFLGTMLVLVNLIGWAVVKYLVN